MGQRGGGVRVGSRARMSPLHPLEPKVSQRPFESGLLLHPPDKRQKGRRGSGGPKRRESCSWEFQRTQAGDRNSIYCGSWG